MTVHKYIQRVLLVSFCLLQTILSNGQQKSKRALEKDFQTATKDVLSWVTYEANEINWVEFNTALTPNGDAISKNDFFDSLKTGQYVPLAVDKNSLKLFPVKSPITQGVTETIIQTSRELQKFYLLEGQTILPVSLKDINENEITNKELAGKVVVFNCWFVKCGPCREEMPDLNRLVKDYSGNKDVIFISLCLDSADEIRDFLKATEFNYNHIPNQEGFINSRFKVTGYPTHVIVDKNLNIVKVMSNRNVGQVRKLIEDVLVAN